jgi:alpha-amylase
MKFTIVFALIALSFPVFPQSLNPIPVEGGTRFFYRSNFPYKINSVAIAGSMNGWDKAKNKMVLNQPDSIWSGVINLSEGIEYSYKLVINDTLWITDPNAPNVTEDEWRNGLITPQKFGEPFVRKIFPAQNQRLNFIPTINILINGVKSGINPASIKLFLDKERLQFVFDIASSEVKAVIDSSLKDGEHIIELAFADSSGAENSAFKSGFFIDRYIKEITTPAFYDSAVIYEVYIRSFYDTQNGEAGSFKGLTKKLNYLKNDLGVNTLWLMPFNESSAEHGYNVTDYYKIEKDYGSFKDYADFIKTSKRLGIKVLMDFVINHTDSVHTFFLDAYKNPASRYTGWYQFINKENTDWRHFGVERKMPKLNFENKDVQDYFIKIAKFWLDPNGDGDLSDGIDGFRCDAAKEIPHQFWNRFRKEIKAVKSDALILGEVWDNANFMIPFYKEEFDMLFDYPFLYALDGYFANNNIDALKNKINELKSIYPIGSQSVRFLANHDNNRALSRYNDTAKLKQAIFIIMTTPGTPMIYYGDEIGLQGKLPPENVRQKMDWTEILRQEKDDNSIFNFYKTMIALRKKYKTLSERDDKKSESLSLLEDEQNTIFSYIRYDANGKYLILVNNSGKRVDSAKLKTEIKIEEIKDIKEIYSSQKTKDKIIFNISKDFLFLNNLNMLNGSFKLFELN